jgi:hypothetical protein
VKRGLGYGVVLAAVLVACTSSGPGEDLPTKTPLSQAPSSSVPASTSPVIPDVVGLSLAQARRAAQDVGLTAVIANRKFSSEPKFTVISQQPVAGADLDGQKLAVTVAITPHVPKLVGLSVQTARTRLADQALDPGKRIKIVVVSPHVCGSPLNPWCFSVLGGGSLIYRPPNDFCLYFNCISSFSIYDNGYVIQCADGEFSHSGGVQGSCSYHGGNWRPLYAP